MIDYPSLIPEMRDWNNGKGIDIGNWIGCSGNFNLAIGYSAIFWPRFVEFEGYVLREGFHIPTLRGFEKQQAALPVTERHQAVESVMNHKHLQDIQYGGCPDVTHERLRHLGQVLKEIYQAKLAWQFPDKKFEVYFPDEPLEDLVDYQLTFYQIATSFHA